MRAAIMPFLFPYADDTRDVLTGSLTANANRNVRIKRPDGRRDILRRVDGFKIEMLFFLKKEKQKGQ